LETFALFIGIVGSPRQGFIVHVYCFALFRPTKQKLLNLQGFLFFFSLKFNLNITHLNFLKTFKLSPLELK
jgi:hypothetical protein